MQRNNTYKDKITIFLSKIIHVIIILLICKNSFDPQTKVWTKSGLVAIATLAALDGTGLAKDSPDQVWSYNEQTGQNELKTVEHVFVNHDEEVTTLELFDPESRSNETLITTPEHPFYVSNKQTNPWVNAGELKIDDEVRKADGSVGIVVYVHTKTEKKVMYNLSVADNHNFFVGENKWLTHNAGNANLSYTITPSLKGLEIIRLHLSGELSANFNDAMIERINKAIQKGEKLKGADANFYLHEINESRLMKGGMSYEEAHSSTLKKYGHIEFDLYHPEVIKSLPEEFNDRWLKHWGIGC